MPGGVEDDEAVRAAIAARDLGSRRNEKCEEGDEGDGKEVSAATVQESVRAGCAD